MIKDIHLAAIFGLIAFMIMGMVANTTALADEEHKLALLVGINDYKYDKEYDKVRGISDLSGPKNDVEIMRGLLVDSFGFPDDAEHIRTLMDEQATRDGIIGAFKEHLIAKAKKDSIVVFHFSGHGSQLKDTKGEEGDKRDETIVTHDSAHGGDPKKYPNRDITDDEINQMLAKLTEITPNVTFIFDSCHSGTMSRGSGTPRIAVMDERPRPQYQPIFADVQVSEAETDNDDTIRSKGAKYALISGSTAKQFSYEKEMGQNNVSHGVMTWHFVKRIKEVGGDATYGEVMEEIRNRMKDEPNTQTPQLEGSEKDRFVFGTKSLVPEPFVSVLSVSKGGKKVTLDVGKIHGVTKGSVYEVYKPGTRSFGKEVKPIAKIKITVVKPITSKAKVVGPIGSKGIPDKARAVERQHNWPDAAFRVHFVGVDKSEILKGVRARLKGFNHIEEQHRDKDYDLLLEEGKGKQKGFVIMELGDSSRISRVAISGNDEDVDRVIEQVTHWAKWSNIRKIHNPKSRLDVEFEIESVDVEYADGSIPIFTEDEDFTISVTNKSDENIHLVLVDLSSDGSVTVAPLTEEDQYISPGQKKEYTFTAMLPEGLTRVRDKLKLFVTTEHSDFSPLAMKGLTRGKMKGSAVGNPLEKLLSNAAHGMTRGADKAVHPGNWTTVERTMEVRE
uniref:Caspase domain-containing protein n=1 Tax=Candidatus Kentrum sp. FW TaxID=2126338 RepID=A0A450U446_9GAMM|nr:MAG: Caspase domain-containing protein [Candidatus Kentron sp. FW]